MSTCHLVTGSTGAGKTTFARALATREGAVLFSIDDWMTTLYWMDVPVGHVDIHWALDRVGRCETMIWKVAGALVAGGTPVVLDLGFSRREQRDRFRALAREAGAEARLHYLDVDVETRRARVLDRNAHKPETFSLEVTPEQFAFMETWFEPPGPDEMG